MGVWLQALTKLKRTVFFAVVVVAAVLCVVGATTLTLLERMMLRSSRFEVWL